LLTACVQRSSLLYSLHFVAFSRCAHRRDLPPFPTRRSSDLQGRPRGLSRDRRHSAGLQLQVPRRKGRRAGALARKARLSRTRHRSEEHTSELQSRENLVCRLLLEKKKKKRRNGERADKR